MVENTCVSSPTSPVPPRVRRSLPECQEDNHRHHALSPEHRRSFRTKGRSSWSTSSDKPSSPFARASARASLRTPLRRGSPSPARKLTAPQGPNLATAGRNRQCRCSEVHHHAPHGHVTPVDKRVPLERERSCRRRGGSNASAEGGVKYLRTPRTSLTAPTSRQSSTRSSPSRGEAISPTRSLSPYEAVVSDRETSVEPPVTAGPKKISNASQSEGSTPAVRKGSVTTMVKWVPWLAEKRFYTTLKVSPASPVITSLPRKGSAEVQKFKIIHTSSTAAPPCFVASIGAPPSVGLSHLSMA